MHIHVEVGNTFSTKHIDAIIKLQSLWRGHRVRRNYISQDHYFSAKQYLDKCQDITGLPKASCGITRVYLPPNLPVVFKALGMQKSKRRFFTMWKARDLCQRNGYRHLLIPTARPYKEYNIEDKLPVHDVKQREQIALYGENWKSFSPAIREFTGFLCQSIFPDILTLSHPYQEENEIPLGRCDNLPLMLDKEDGKIALIDLGGHQIRKGKPSSAEALECAKTVIFIFPYHFDDIFDVVKTFCPGIIEKRLHLQELCAQALTRFKKIYENHRDFVQKKIISGGLSRHSFSEQRKQVILQKVQSSLSTASKRTQPPASDRHDVTSLNEEALAFFIEKVISLLINESTKNKTPKQPLIPYVCSRSIALHSKDLSDMSQGRLSKSNAQIVLKIILDELVQGNELCYVNKYTNRFKESVFKIHY